MSLKLGAGGALIQGSGGALSLACCCPPGVPVIEWDSVSASAEKKGVLESTGFASTPPKVYRRVDYSGTRETISAGGVHFEDTWSGYTELVDPPVGGFTLSLITTWVIASRSGGSVCSDPMGPITNTDQGNAFISGSYYFAFSGTVRTAFSTVAAGAPISATQYGSPTAVCSGSNIAELSDEYLAADLLAEAIASLPAFDDDWNDTAGSAYSISTNEFSLSIRSAKWRGVLPACLISGKTYRLVYQPRFTPTVGSPTLGAEDYIEFTWDGSATHVDGETVDIPTGNGVNDIVPLRWDCP